MIGAPLAGAPSLPLAPALGAKSLQVSAWGCARTMPQTSPQNTPGQGAGGEGGCTSQN